MSKVPAGWGVKTLGMICNGKLQTGPFGSQLYSHEYSEVGIPVLMPKDLINCRADLGSAAKIPPERAVDLKKHTLKKGDLLFSRRGDVARFALIEGNSIGALCGTGCLKASPTENYSSEFLMYCLQLDTVKTWLEQNAVGQTMLNMNTSILSELPLFISDNKREQERIAQILSTWDKAIATTEKLIGNSQQQKKALMQSLLTGKKRLPGFEGEWEQVRLGNVCQMSSGGTPKSTVSEYYGGEIPWVSIADMTKQGMWISRTERNLTQEGIDNSSARVYPVNTILYAMYASIGECSIAKVAVASSQAILGIRPNENVFYLYIYYFLSSLKEEVKLQGQQGTQANLNAGMVKDFSLKLPPLPEQQKIAAILTAADNEIDLLQKKLAFLKQEKAALMQQLLTGKRRVKVEAA
ncbi:MULTISPECIES: restriction endonuclease subunit S [Rahnella]|uniref:restriction endonuclease subunit S n=1 Tax=Rahnella TaxID=34037 RepID=UPI003D2CA57E